MFLPAIHTANRIANKIVPLASKPITQVPDNLLDPPRHHVPTEPRHTSEANQRAPRQTETRHSFGDQSESSTGEHHVCGCHVRHTYAHDSPWQPN